MKDNFSIGLVIGFIIGFVVMAYQTWKWPSNNQIGMTFIEVKEAKELCEKSLPRDKQCKVIINFVEEN